MMVNWDKPIEAVHEDGRVVAVVVEDPADSDPRIGVRFPDDDYELFNADGSAAQPFAECNSWRIRNVAQTTTVAPKLVERMVAFIRRCDGLSSDRHDYAAFVGRATGDQERELRKEARAIMAELEPKPESDEDAARRMMIEHDYPDSFGLKEAIAWARANPR